jgi:hypothetical protein
MSTDSVEVTDDLSAQIADRLAHAEQYLNESLKAVREAIALGVKAGWEDDED